jgi:catechol 2,3-dioxygenase-like lactoylglutathione lyase family enzyme
MKTPSGPKPMKGWTRPIRSMEIYDRICKSIFVEILAFFSLQLSALYFSFLLMKPPFTLGVVGHFGLAVRDPKKSAQWFQRVLGLRKEFEFENGVAVGNENVTIVLFKGKPSPETLEHMSFHLPDMATLRKALDHLKKHDVDLEDPGDEIGPEAPGSPHMGLWFHDLDGYRWELSVQGGK